MTGSQKNVFSFSAFSVVNGCCNVAVCFFVAAAKWYKGIG